MRGSMVSLRLSAEGMRQVDDNVRRLNRCRLLTAPQINYDEVNVHWSECCERKTHVHGHGAGTKDNSSRPWRDL